MNSEEWKLPIGKAFDFLGAFGNFNILRNHIVFFRDKAQTEIRGVHDYADWSFSQFPYFLVWLRLNCEYLTNRLFFIYARKEKKEIVDEVISNRGITYEKIKNWFYKNCNSQEAILDFKYQRDNDVEILIELSHCFRHGGNPNIVREIKGIHDSKTKKRIDFLLAPNNFLEIEKFFVKIENWFDSIPLPTILFMDAEKA